MSGKVMDKTQMESTLKMLQTAVTNQQPSEQIIDVLEQLKAVHVTEDLIRATRAGVMVGKQRSHTDKAVARLATEVVTKWKKDIEAEKKKKVLVPKTDKWVGPDPAKRKWQDDGVDIKRTGKQSRDNCIGLLYNGLAYMSRESCTSVILKAMEIEKAAFDVYKGESDDYKKKMRSLFQNLKQNRELSVSVLKGETAASKFVVMTQDELKTTKLKEQEEELEKDNMKRAQVPMAQKSISDALTCGKCKQKKVSYSQAQTRSADEPMTTFCECMVCGNRWKFS